MQLARLTFQNPWIVAVDGAVRPARSRFVLTLGVLICAIAIVLGRKAGAVLAGAVTGGMSGPWAEIAAQICFYLCVFGPLWIAAVAGGLVEGRTVWRTEAGVFWSAPAGLAIGALGYSLAVALASALGAIAPGTTAQAALPGGLLVGALIIAFQAGGEEIFFRGWMQPVLCARLGPWVGMLITAALFVSLHLVGGVRSPLAVVNLMLGGLLFGLLALRTGGLWSAFAAHWAWNWTEFGGWGLEPNPGVAPTGAWIDLDLTGPALWSGGGDGMNGSLAATLVLIVLVVGVTAATPQRTAAAQPT